MLAPETTLPTRCDTFVGGCDLCADAPPIGVHLKTGTIGYCPQCDGSYTDSDLREQS